MDAHSVAVSGQLGSAQSSGAPCIHATNLGFSLNRDEGLRRRAVDGFPAPDGGLVIAPVDSNAAVLGGSWSSGGKCAGYSPARSIAVSSRPGGLLCPPPVRRPLSREAVSARVLFRSVVAIGVGSKRTASSFHLCATSLSVVPEWPVEPVPLFAVAFRPFRLSPSTGVGRSRTASSSIGPPVRLSPLTCVPLCVRAIGVGSNGIDPVTRVRGAGALLSDG